MMCPVQLLLHQVFQLHLHLSDSILDRGRKHALMAMAGQELRIAAELFLRCEV